MQRTSNNSTVELLVNMRTDLTQKANWAALAKELNLASVDVHSKEYEEMLEKTEREGSLEAMVNFFKMIPGVQPVQNVPQPDYAGRAAAGVDNERGTEPPKDLYGIGGGVRYSSDSGIGAEMALVGLRALGDEQRRIVTDAFSTKVMAGGGFLCGYGRLLEHLRTGQQRQGIRIPKAAEVREAMRRCRFPCMLDSEYGVTPALNQLVNSTSAPHVLDGVDNVEERRTNRKFLVMEDSNYMDKRDDGGVSGVRYVGSTTGDGSPTSKVIVKRCVNEGGVIPYTYRRRDLDKVIRRRRTTTETKDKMDLDNIVTYNIHARAGPLYDHARLEDVLPQVLVDACRVIEQKDAMNAQFAKAARLNEAMPLLEAEEVMVVAIERCYHKFYERWEEISVANLALWTNTLVVKTDKYSMDKVLNLKQRLYVESCKAVQLPIAEFTQSLQELLKKRGITPTHRAAIKLALLSEQTYFKPGHVYTHTTLGYNFTHGGQDTLWSYFDSVLEAQGGVMYLHNGDDNIMAVRTKSGIAIVLLDCTSFDNTIVAEVKRPVVETVAKFGINIDPSGSALWAHSMLDTVVNLQDKRTIKIRDMQFSGLNGFAEVNDLLVDVWLDRVRRAVVRDGLHKTEDEDISDKLLNLATVYGDQLGLKIRLEGKHYVHGAQTIKQALREVDFVYLGFNHYLPTITAAMPRVRCYLDPPRFFTSLLMKTQWIKQHSDYRVQEVIRIASILLSFGTPPQEWQPAFDAMCAHWQTLYASVKTENATLGDEHDYEDEQLIERAPHVYARGHFDLKPHQPLVMMNPQVMSDELVEAFRSLEGIKGAMDRGNASIWNDRSKGLDYLLKTELELHEDHQDVDSWADSSAMDPARVLVFFNRQMQDGRLLEFQQQLMEEEAGMIPQLGRSLELDLAPVVRPGSLHPATQEIVRTIVGSWNWASWGRVPPDLDKRAEARRRRRQNNRRNKARKKADHDDDEDEAVYRPHEKKETGMGGREVSRSVREALEDGSLDPYDAFYAAKNLGPNPRKKGK